LGVFCKDILGGKMRIHCIIHASFEKIGAIETWAKKGGHSLSFTHTYKEQELPNIDSFDFLIVMGGPQSPLEVEKYPYLRNEIKLIEKAIQGNKKIFGVCLGAQLISEALGAKTLRSPNKEIGMYSIEILDAAKEDPIFKKLPKTFDVMHWHSDMPGIPDGGVLLAKSEGCPQQAFKYGDRIYGFQFHLEPTKELIEGMIANCPEDLKPGRYIRSEEELLNSDFDAINKKMFIVLDYMASLPDVVKEESEKLSFRCKL
jgi:GMP synthase (glutamine-hydrolysing)